MHIIVRTERSRKRKEFCRCKAEEDIDVNSDVDSDAHIVNSNVNTAENSTNINNPASVDKSNLSGSSVNRKYI